MLCDWRAYSHLETMIEGINMRSVVVHEQSLFFHLSRSLCKVA